MTPPPSPKPAAPHMPPGQGRAQARARAGQRDNPSAAPQHAPSPKARWRHIRLVRQRIQHDLRSRHRLRWHGMAMGTLTLMVMWVLSAALRALGVDSLALRYALVLGAGYGVYLLVLRVWAGRLVQPLAPASAPDRAAQCGDAARDALDIAQNVASNGAGDFGASLAQSALGRAAPAPGRWSPGGGGDFSGAGAGASFDGAEPDGLLDAGASSEAVSDLAKGALELAGSAADSDEAAVVVVPVMVVFAVLSLVLLSAGSFVWLLMGSEALLAVAVELAFAITAARTAVQVEQLGWLKAAVRVSAKPLLGSLLCAVALGAVIDLWLPQAATLPQAVRLMLAAGR